jgi:hypothetical protein
MHVSTKSNQQFCQLRVSHGNCCVDGRAARAIRAIWISASLAQNFYGVEIPHGSSQTQGSIANCIAGINFGGELKKLVDQR